MARNRFTPEQIVAILREVERSPHRQDAFCKHGISEQTFYRWRKMTYLNGRCRMITSEPVEGAIGEARLAA